MNCKDCPDRSMTCHISCERYRLFKEELQRRKDKEKIDNDIRNYRNETITKTKDKLAMRQRKLSEYRQFRGKR